MVGHMKYQETLRSRIAATPVVVAIAVAIGTAPVAAQPTGGNVVAGSASFDEIEGGEVLGVNQTSDSANHRMANIRCPFRRQFQFQSTKFRRCDLESRSGTGRIND